MTQRRQRQQQRDSERILFEFRQGDTQERLIIYDAVRAEYARQLRQRRHEHAAATAQPTAQPAPVQPILPRRAMLALVLAEARVGWDSLLDIIDALGWAACVTLPMWLTRRDVFVYVDYRERLWVVYRQYGPPLVLGG